MTPPAWYEHAQQTLEREQLRPAPSGRRVRRWPDGMLGWYQDGAIAQGHVRALAYWQAISQEDQEDFATPFAAGYLAHDGWWLPVEDWPGWHRP